MPNMWLPPLSSVWLSSKPAFVPLCSWPHDLLGRSGAGWRALMRTFHENIPELPPTQGKTTEGLGMLPHQWKTYLASGRLWASEAA